MSSKILDRYKDIFCRLHTNKNRIYGVAPHKPLLLLAVMEEIKRGNILHNFIEITPELVATFRAYWRILVPANTWLERIANPFRFMIYEGFWTLVKADTPVSPNSLGDTPYIRQLQSNIDGAVLVADLWQLLQDNSAINSLQATILNEYFGVGIVEVQPKLPAKPLDYEVERLVAEANSRFRVRMVSENKDETGYFVRHALFPEVVIAQYANSCAVCSLAARTTDSQGIVDAAHIMPFSEFHNDDPRNGISLCKNHHWGFDSGWYTISNDYKVIASPKLHEAAGYVQTGTPIVLPVQIECAPAKEALEYHRKHVFIK